MNADDLEQIEFLQTETLEDLLDDFENDNISNFSTKEYWLAAELLATRKALKEEKAKNG